MEELLPSVLVLLLAISEFLGGFTVVKSNSIYQVVIGALKKLVGK